MEAHVDFVLGVSMAPETIRLVVIEGQDADGVTVEQDEFEVAAGGVSATTGAIDQVMAAVGGTREGALEGGHRLASTGITCTNPVLAGALRDAMTDRDVEGVMLVAPLLAAAALAQTVGSALDYEQIAMLFVEPESATLAVVDVGDGSIVDLHRHRVTAPHDVRAAELATMVAGMDARGSWADGVFLVGCGTDIVYYNIDIRLIQALSNFRRVYFRDESFLPEPFARASLRMLPVRLSCGSPAAPSAASSSQRARCWPAS